MHFSSVFILSIFSVPDMVPCTGNTVVRQKDTDAMVPIPQNRKEDINKQ